MQLSRRSAMGLVAMHALASSAVARAQIPQPKKPATASPASQAGMPDVPGLDRQEQEQSGPMRERMQITAEKARNDDRRKRMLADTDKLLALSTELKAYIEKSTRDELSMDVIRKAAEIEKLARDVQQRMKN